MVLPLPPDVGTSRRRGSLGLDGRHRVATSSVTIRKKALMTPHFLVSMPALGEAGQVPRVRAASGAHAAPQRGGNYLKYSLPPPCKCLKLHGFMQKVVVEES